jgi:hypothetical protein
MSYKHSRRENIGAPLEMALSLTDASISAKLGAVKLNVGSLQQQAEIELMLF